MCCLKNNFNISQAQVSCKQSSINKVCMYHLWNIFWYFDELLSSLSLRKINRGDRRNAGRLHLCDWRAVKVSGRQGSDTVFFCCGALFIIYLIWKIDCKTTAQLSSGRRVVIQIIHDFRKNGRKKGRKKQGIWLAHITDPHTICEKNNLHRVAWTMLDKKIYAWFYVLYMKSINLYSRS